MTPNISACSRTAAPLCAGITFLGQAASFMGLTSFKDITDQQFGLWTVIKYTGNQKWLCQCRCGIQRNVNGSDLRNGSSRSCGMGTCTQRSTANTTHGETRKGKSPEYQIWLGIKRRCTNPKATGFANYGGRGIKMCERWAKDFTAFLSDMGRRPPGTFIERIDNNGNYEPTNCKWATRLEQANNARSNRLLTLNGETKTATQWARLLNLPAEVIRHRLDKGWSFERILKTPVVAQRPRLTNEEVLHIRKLGKSHKITEVARLTGISFAAASRIIKRQSWRYL
jgi:hypothetical protein